MKITSASRANPRSRVSSPYMNSPWDPTKADWLTPYMNTLSFLKEFLKKGEISPRWASPPNRASSLPYEQRLKVETKDFGIFTDILRCYCAGWENEAIVWKEGLNVLVLWRF